MFSILFQSQLHLQVQPHLSSARLPLLGSGTTKLLHLDHLSDLLSQPHLPRPQLLGPNPILPRPLDSRVTPPLYLGKVLIPHQVSGWLSSLMILVVTLKCNTFFFFFFKSGGGFQFGGTSAFGATTNNTSGVFTFGAGSSASPAPPANPSIAPQSGAPGGGFNFGQTPTFNIGYVAFSQFTANM